MAPNAEGLSGAMEEGVVDVREVEETKKAAAAEEKVGIFFSWHWLTFLGRIFQ